MNRIAISLLTSIAALAGGERRGPETRFDLVCTYSGRLIADPGRRDSGSEVARNRPWSGTSRYSVDLDSMRYCMNNWCWTRGPAPIAALSASEIVLVDDRSAEPRIRVSVRRSDGYFEERISASEGFLSLTTGSCTTRPFSRFRPARDRAD